jgi:hypothetical protein
LNSAPVRFDEPSNIRLLTRAALFAFCGRPDSESERLIFAQKVNRNWMQRGILFWAVIFPKFVLVMSVFGP